MIAEFSAPLMIIAAGQVMLLICGEIDLSVGNVFAFSAWIFYFANTSWHLPLILGGHRRPAVRRRSSASRTA